MWWVMWEKRTLSNVVFCSGGCVGAAFNCAVIAWTWAITALSTAGDCGFGGCWKVCRICWSLKNGKTDKPHNKVQALYQDILQKNKKLTKPQRWLKIAYRQSKLEKRINIFVMVKSVVNKHIRDTMRIT